jgi:O-antigen ligase
MRAVFGILGLLLVVAIVGVLAKKQLSAVAPPAATSAGVPAPVTPKQQVDQFKQSVESTMQQPRSMPEDTK